MSVSPSKDLMLRLYCHAVMYRCMFIIIIIIIIINIIIIIIINIIIIIILFNYIYILYIKRVGIGGRKKGGG